jgi:hypothetical protein
LYRHKIEEDNVAKGRRIQELGKEVEALKKRKDDERAAQKTGKASCNKLKEELAEVHRSKMKEASLFNMATVEIMGRYHECLCGVGADTELPADCNAASWNGCAAKSLPWMVI